MQSGINGLFQETGGSGTDTKDSTNLGNDYLQANASFLENFKTPTVGVNGYGPILNANANLLPTQADQYRDISSFHDYKLNNGLSVARQYRKSDSMGGNTETGFSGYAEPSKMFG